MNQIVIHNQTQACHNQPLIQPCLAMVIFKLIQLNVMNETKLEKYIYRKIKIELFEQRVTDK